MIRLAHLQHGCVQTGVFRVPHFWSTVGGTSRHSRLDFNSRTDDIISISVDHDPVVTITMETDTYITILGTTAFSHAHTAADVVRAGEPAFQPNGVLNDNTIRDGTIADRQPQLDITNPNIVRDDDNTGHDSINQDHVVIPINISLHGNGADPGYPKADAVLSISIVRSAIVYDHPNSNTCLVISCIIRDVTNTAVGTFKPHDIICSTVPCRCDLVTFISICGEDISICGEDISNSDADDAIALTDDVGICCNNCSTARDTNISKHEFNVTIGHAHTHTHHWNTEFEIDQSALSYHLDATHLDPANHS
ncbi:uncharacterized protein LOC144902340 [Branchiostoma floridae x Branchiostoma belcheri]